MALTKVTSGTITDNSVTSAKIAVDVIVAEDIAANAITVAELQDNAVTTAKITDANVTTAKVADDAITTAKVADDAITSALIADDAIDSAQIADGAVDNAHLATGIDAAKVTTGTLPMARLSGTLPALNGSALTNLPAQITKSTSEPTISTNPSGGVGTLWLRTTTGEMYCCTDATTGANHWTNIGGGSGNIKPWIAATGGSIVTSGNYKIHTFTSSANFQITSGNSSVEYLVVAGGGGGGGTNRAGGAGAGGRRAGT